MAYETYGTLAPARDNVILVCHALSGDAHAAGFSRTPGRRAPETALAPSNATPAQGRGLGWWDGMIGPGKAFDTDRFFVVSSNLLGGCRGTTGPSSTNPATGRPYGSDFPVITVADMVRAERALLDQLGIARLAAVAGGSLGGMQALEWAVTYPDQVDAIVPIASTHALQPQGVAWNAIARNAITSDPDWQGGHYHGTGRAPTAGMGVARMVGHITYLSAVSLGTKFGRRLQNAADIRYTLTEPEFEVESYLRHQADSFVKRFDANTYLYTSRALSYFDLARQYGDGQLARALRTMAARTLFIAFSSDWLYPPAGSEELADALRATGKPVELHVIDAPYGHDCFLLEEARQTPMIQAFLARCQETAPHGRVATVRIRDPSGSCRPAPRPEYGRARGPDLPDHQLRLRGSRIGGGVLQPAGVRQHLLAHHEPDGGGVRGADRQPRGRVGAVAFASGIAAQAAALFTLLSPGDHVVSSSALYGGTVNQLKHLLRKMSVELTWVNPDDPDAWKAAVRANTKAFFAETIGNPAGNVLDIEAVARIAHDHELPLLVDNTFASPFLCRPIEWGADIVLHSATKFIGGHGTSIGGVVVDSGQFNWSNGRYPVVAEPSPAYHGLQFHETFGTYGYLMKLRAETLRDLGAGDEPVQRLPVPARPRDAVVAHGAPRRERRGRGALSRRPRTGVARNLSGIAVEPLSSPGRQVPAARRRRGVLVRLPGRARRRTGLHSGRDAVVTPRERGRCQEPDHPPGQHHASSAERRRAARGGRGCGHDPSVGRDRRRGGPDLGSGSRLRTRGPGVQSGGVAMTRLRSPPLSGSADDPAGDPQREDGGDRRPVEERAAGQLLRGLLPAAARLPGHPRQPGRIAHSGRTQLQALADVPVHVDIVNVFRAPDALPEIAEQAVAIGAGNLWCQFTVVNEEGGRIAEAGGVSVVMDRCLKVEHARYVGRMHWLGFNTGIITSVRGGLQ